MAEEIKKGVVIEFDFTVAPGSDLLFNATAEMFKEYEIPFSRRIESQYLTGGNYLGGLADYFNVVKTKKTPAKAAKDLATAFADALSAKIPECVNQDFKDFANFLIERNTKVIVATRADFGAIADAFADLTPNPDFHLYQEISPVYGALKWDDWRRAAASNRIRSIRTLAVAGSGFSVKSALLAGMGVVAVPNPNVEYQDFSGTDEFFTKLDRSAAERIAKILRI